MEKNSNLLVAHHLLGAPLVIEKKLVSKTIRFYFQKNSILFQNSFSKFHHTHEHEPSLRHQQGLIGLI